MNCLLRLLIIALAFFSAAAPLHRAYAAPPLERGVAITDPDTLRELDRGRFGLAGMLASSPSRDQPLSDAALFALPSMASLTKSLDQEFERYLQHHKTELADQTIGIGTSFDFQLFDRAELYSPTTRFVLAGIVNRMDRSYVQPENCGEIRLIYRLTQIDAPLVGDHQASARLPMTLNLILKAKSEEDKGLSCAELARRWFASGEWTLAGAELAERLSAPGGPLEQVRPDHIMRIETNLQIVHVAQSPGREFRTDYLLKVFDYQRNTNTFEEATLENQIDRARIMADEGLRRDFKAWLLGSAGVKYDARNCIVIAFGMGLAVVPIIFTISEDALSSVPEHLKAASLALGATPWQTATRVVVPTASAGIFSAVMLGFGRAVGETMIVLMATGNTPVMDGSIFDGMRTLSANIAVEISEAPQGGTLYRVLFLAALLLFILTFVVNTAAEILRQRLRGKYSAI